MTATLGLEVADADADEPPGLGLARQHGGGFPLVAAVTAGSVAEAAGVVTGARLLKVNGAAHCCAVYHNLLLYDII